MSRTRKIHITLSVLITISFLCIGAFLCCKSYIRFFETLLDLFDSVRFYFCEVFGIEHSTTAGILDSSSVLEEEITALPSSSPSFWLRVKVFFRLLISGRHLGGYFNGVGKVIGYIAYYIMLFLPFVLALAFLVKAIYNHPNKKHNIDTLPLKAFKKISGATYQPVKRFILGYVDYLHEKKWWRKLWLWIWLFNINFVSIIVAAIAYCFYFTVSFDLASIYPQIVNLFKDLLLVIRHFPWYLTGIIAWVIFSRWREKKALDTLLKHEARNCGFINALPIVTMTCGSMGKKKTTMTTDMALSQTVMFRQEAFERLQAQDMKFPFFPWIAFEMDIKDGMKNGTIYNLASIHTWVTGLFERYIDESSNHFDLYGYDVDRYGLYYYSGIKEEFLFEVLETYAKLYFIYVIESSLIVSNYSIRTEDMKDESENFPLRYDSFFNVGDCKERFAHILDFDVLRLGRKVIENNPKAGSFEFGVVVITEVGKERANNLELKELKKTADETNQKNDMFNAWLKMCRHSATVDNFPFIKVFTDEQRPESWGADARDLADIITIVESGEMRLVLPYITIEAWLYEKTFYWFMKLYYHFRNIRGDNTLFMHLLKGVISKIYTHYIRIYNKYGYSVLYVSKENGTRKGPIKNKVYYLSNYKIYRDRFTTDCFSDYFNDLAEKSGIGLKDYLCYDQVKASVEELKSQNSYFIRSLYGD